ncbi:MAG: DUF5916 domain-containing protein [Bacteroidota bacterium]
MVKNILLFCFVPALLLFAADKDTNSPEAVKGVRALRTDSPITIDGIHTENVWQICPGISGLKQRDPLEGKDASEQTVVKIAYDNEAIYVAAKMYDSAPDSIIGRLGRRDGSLNADLFTFYIDSYLDKRTGYYFSINPSGTFFDGVLYNDDWSDNSWDGIWEGRAAIGNDGWSVEMRIPFSQLKFHKNDKYVWGVNFKRVIERKHENDYLVFTPKNASGFVSRFVSLEGIENIALPKQLEIIPYITGKAEYLRHDKEDPFRDGSNYLPGVGADLKMGLGGNLTLNATINPDFGQVEVDPAVVNLSDAETYFDEKRPFFVEGSTIFNFGFGGVNNWWGFNWPGPDLFYSRRIGRYPQGNLPDNDYSDVPSGTHILAAAKLTGKVLNNWNIGTINAFTQREHAEYSYDNKKNTTEVEPFSHYGVIRMQRDFNSGKQGLGFMGTYTTRFFSQNSLRDDINSGAYVFGLDGWTALDKDKEWMLAGWAAGSYITGSKNRITDVQTSSVHYFQRPDASHLSVDSNATYLAGYSGRLYLNKQKGNMFLNASLGIVDPGFETNDVGFLWRTDVINMHVGSGYKWTQPGKFSRYMELGLAYFRTMDFAYDVTSEGLFHFGNIDFLNYYSINWNLAYNPQTVSNRRTRGGPLSLNYPGWQVNFSAYTDNRKPWIISAGYYHYLSQEEASYNFWTGVEWRPAANISLSIEPSFDTQLQRLQWVDSFDDKYAIQTFGKRYVFARMNQKTFAAGIRMNWTFTPFLSLQLYVQPLISTGAYSSFKELARPRSFDYSRYGEGSSTISKNENNEYTVDPDGSGPAEEFTFDNPDFNYKSLRGNAVLRWEYKPGSTLYLVWTQNRDDSEDEGKFNFGRSFRRLFDKSCDNIFMLKFTYWFSI